MNDRTPAVPGIKATGWLVLQGTRYAGGRARGMKLVRVTQNPPALDGTEVSIKLSVMVPASVFDKGIAAISIEVPEELISEPDVAVQAI